MIHPSTELKFISPEKGYGVVAKAFIPKGTITWVQDELDRVFTDKDLEKFDAAYREILDEYCFRDQNGHHILCWDIGRFVNHSFKSNCMTTPYNFEIAIRDIYPGEELTDDYGYLNISEPFSAIPEDSERTVVYPDDLLRLYPQWDAQISEAFPFIHQVTQPLHTFLPKMVQNKIDNIIFGQDSLASILTCYYEPHNKKTFSLGSFL